MRADVVDVAGYVVVVDDVDAVFGGGLAMVVLMLLLLLRRWRLMATVPPVKLRWLVSRLAWRLVCYWC